MKFVFSTLTAAVMALAFAGAQAQTPAGDRAPDPKPGPKVSAAEKEAGRAQRKAETAAAKKKGDVTPAGDTVAPGPAAKVEGTHQGRQAERAASRAQMTKDEKAGKVPRPSETGATK